MESQIRRGGAKFFINFFLCSVEVSALNSFANYLCEKGGGRRFNIARAVNQSSEALCIVGTRGTAADDKQGRLFQGYQHLKQI